MQARPDRFSNSGSSGTLAAHLRQADLAAAQPLRVLACPYINAFNPYTELLYTHLQRHSAIVQVDEFRFWRSLCRRYHIAHFHWPDFHFNHWRAWPKQMGASLLVILGLIWLKLRGTKVVWTAHNLGAHEHGDHPLALAFRRVFHWFVDGIIFLTRSSLTAFYAERTRPCQVPKAVIPHGHYLDVVSRAQGRPRPVGKRTLLYFGQIRPYKNVDTLVRCFARAKAQGRLQDWRLVMAGRPMDEATAGHIRSLAGNHPDIHLRLDFVPQHELDELVAASDLVVLPYKRILNSGSVLYALSLGRPVLGPEQGSLPEIRDLVGKDWLNLYQGELTPQLLADALEGHPAEQPEALPPLAWADWRTIAAQTHAFYTRVLDPT